MLVIFSCAVMEISFNPKKIKKNSKFKVVRPNTKYFKGKFENNSFSFCLQKSYYNNKFKSVLNLCHYFPYFNFSSSLQFP